ncbi:MarR family winged helix-turn-helix transcriptional regulator [Streptomyces sp. NPDC018031]|uniref:MarR family winged helix-turn-helix transcriptional regulator n=1 Tax=Streptomyces sp. NPDC018031 TaxID=3365033 RepID=UPI003790540F
MADRLERLERELMLLARCHVMTPRERRSDRPYQLERSAYVLLSRLDAEGPMSIGRLAEAFQLDVSTVNRQTAGLLRLGLLERIPDPDGGLARKLRMTEVGAKRLAADRTLRRDGLGRILADWTPDELADFEAALTRFNRVVEEYEGRDWPRRNTEPPPPGD